MVEASEQMKYVTVDYLVMESSIYLEFLSASAFLAEYLLPEWSMHCCIAVHLLS